MCTCGGQRMTWGSHYSLSAIGIPRMELVFRLGDKHLCLVSCLTGLTLGLIVFYWLTTQVRPADQEALEKCLSPTLRHWVCKCTQPPLLSYVGSGESNLGLHLA